MSNNVSLYARRARNETDVAKKIDALSKAIEELGKAVDDIEKKVEKLR